MRSLVEMELLVKKARSRLLRMHYENKIGHIGGNLSSLDAILLLHLSAMKAEDVFVLSKGHSAGALYIALWMRGKIPEEALSTFHRDKTKLAGHPISGWNPGIRFSTGSLGHGFGLAAGLALAKKLRKESGTIYCMMSDGEWQEGSVWEALIFTAHHQLDNLTVLIDFNGLQGFGKVKEVASMDDLAKKIGTFNVAIQEVDGHDLESIESALQKKPNRPSVIILKTVKGHGVSFMENKMEWHYLPMTEAQHAEAQREIGA